MYHCGGRLLSGGSAVNYGGWIRGHATDFDECAKAVGDERWSYKGMLAYSRRTETYHTSSDDPRDSAEHGYNRPVHTVGITRILKTSSLTY